jgi:hypothetical protein
MKFFKRKKMKRGISRFLNNLLLSFVIFSVLFYPLIFSWSYVSAQESETTVTETADSSSGGSEATEEEAEEEPEEEAAEEEPVETVIEEEESVVEPKTEVQDLGENVLSETSQNMEITDSLEIVAGETPLPESTLSESEESDFWKTCEFNDEEKGWMEGEECQECRKIADCEEINVCLTEKITAINNTESFENNTKSESITGENEIAGVAGNPESSETGTEPAGSETAAEEDADGEEAGDESTAAETEENPADPEAAVIAAGDAAAQAGVVNEINTNIYTDNGQEVIENINGDYSGDINLLETFESILENSENLCEQNEEAFEKITVANINTAEEVENKVSAEAKSGGNKILDVDGAAAIITGSAEAVASAVNLINTNITGNNWLLAIINIFGNWSGDLIVPGEGLLSTPAGKMIFDKIVSVNYASNVQNFVYAEAQSGNNAESSIAGDASIETGEAAARASAVNLINTNIVKNNWFFLLINNAGNWVGRVINWDEESGEQRTVYEYAFGSLDEEMENDSGKIVSVYNYNEASQVSNYVIAEANSGNNAIANAGSALIQTGNASAFASAFNFVNTNITGNNWLFGIVNNAGNWTGNVIFGYPDLEVDLSANKNQVEPGGSFVYTVKYKNIGKAKCDNTELMFSLPKYLSYLSDTGENSQEDGGNYYWSAAGLKPGEERSFNIAVKLDEDVPNGVTTLESSTGVRTETAEKELSNNYESESVKIAFPPTITIEDGDYWKQGSAVEVSRSENSRIAMGELMSHFIMIKNSGKNTLYNIVVTERIKDPSGHLAAEYFWVIEKLKKGQKATIEYQIFLSPPASLGTYKHTASALGYNEYNFEVQSKKSSANVELVAGGGYFSTSEETPIETVQGAETSALPSLQVSGTPGKNLGEYFRWLGLLLLAIPAYYIWKKRLWEWQKIQRFAKQTASLLSSFF